MSENNHDSLKQAIQKRKTQQMIKEIETRKTALQTGTLPAASPPKRTTQSVTPSRVDTVRNRPAPDMKRTATTMKAVNAPPQRVVTRPIKLIAVLGAALLLLLGIQSVSTPAARITYQATFQPLPTFSVDEVIAHFRLAGVSVNTLQTVPSAQLAPLKASVGVKFNVQQAVGQFMLLTYDNNEAANQGAFRASLTSDYKQWHSIKASNVVLLASPNTSPILFLEMSSHIRQYVVAPYRSFLPTATTPIN